MHLPLREWHNRSQMVFVTVCAAKRKRIFAHEEVHAVFRNAWERAAGWMTGRYVILPDHVHFFCAPAVAEARELKLWIQYWKTLVSRIWPRPEEQPIWQDGFWDRQLRSTESYAAKWEYVVRNPVRHGLVVTPEAWPFQGEMNILDWHE